MGQRRPVSSSALSTEFSACFAYDGSLLEESSRQPECCWDGLNRCRLLPVEYAGERLEVTAAPSFEIGERASGLAALSERNVRKRRLHELPSGSLRNPQAPRTAGSTAG